MITYELDREKAVLWVNPVGPLAEGDFEELASVTDTFLEERGVLAGLMIQTQDFPGWEGLGAMIDHFQFVRGHHARIKRVALVTDSRLGGIAERLASHFVSATIKNFPFDRAEDARAWLDETT